MDLHVKGVTGRGLNHITIDILRRLYQIEYLKLSDPNVTDLLSMTPIFYYVLQGARANTYFSELAKLLDLSQVNYQGENVFHLIARFDRRSLFDSLIPLTSNKFFFFKKTMKG